MITLVTAARLESRLVESGVPLIGMSLTPEDGRARLAMPSMVVHRTVAVAWYSSGMISRCTTHYGTV
jgi:hypothetical protein